MASPEFYDTSKVDSLLSAKQPVLSQAQTAAVNSGITAQRLTAIESRPTGIEDFSATRSYAAGDLVKHDGYTYRCTSATEPGAWTSSFWSRVIGATDIAEPFSSEKEYLKGDVVSHDGKVWAFDTFTAAGAHEWEPASWTEITPPMTKLFMSPNKILHCTLVYDSTTQKYSISIDGMDSYYGSYVIRAAEAGAVITASWESGPLFTFYGLDNTLRTGLFVNIGYEGAKYLTVDNHGNVTIRETTFGRHASTHATGGSDQLTPAAIGALATTDVVSPDSSDGFISEANKDKVPTCGAVGKQINKKVDCEVISNFYCYDSASKIAVCCNTEDGFRYCNKKNIRVIYDKKEEYLVTNYYFQYDYEETGVYPIICTYIDSYGDEQTIRFKITDIVSGGYVVNGLCARAVSLTHAGITSLFSSDDFKSAVEACFDNGETEGF